MENLYYEALRRALPYVSMILVERIILLVDGKQQTKSGKRYADIVEVGYERKRLSGCPIKLIVYCRLGHQLTWECPVWLKKDSGSGFKFSDLVQISKANRLIGFGDRLRAKIKTPRDER